MEVAFSDVSRAIVDVSSIYDTAQASWCFDRWIHQRDRCRCAFENLGPLVVVDNVTTRPALNVASEIVRCKNIEQIAGKRTVPLNQSRWGRLLARAEKRQRAAGDLYVAPS